MEPERRRILLGTRPLRWVLPFAAVPGFLFGQWFGRELSPGGLLVTVLLLAVPIAVICGWAEMGVLPSLSVAVLTGRGGAEGAWTAWIPGPPTSIFAFTLIVSLLSYSIAANVGRWITGTPHKD